MVFRFRNTRQPTAGADEYAFLGAPGKPAFLPMGNGVNVVSPLAATAPGTYVPNNRGAAQQAVPGIVTGGFAMAPLETPGAGSPVGNGHSLDGIAAALNG